jgi:hypothetical protein
VSRLPWFRSGWKPEWARDLLQRSLNEDERKRVRRVILEAIGIGNRRSVPREDDLHIDLKDRRGSPPDRVKADRIMLDYLLPILQSSRQLFALPDVWARRVMGHGRAPGVEHGGDATRASVSGYVRRNDTTNAECWLSASRIVMRHRLGTASASSSID